MRFAEFSTSSCGPIVLAGGGEAAGAVAGGACACAVAARPSAMNDRQQAIARRAVVERFTRLVFILSSPVRPAGLVWAGRHSTAQSPWQNSPETGRSNSRARMQTG